MAMVLAHGGSMSEAIAERRSVRRGRRAWYLYDFGNSAYAAVVLLAVYSAYFKGQVVGGAEGSRLWGLSVGIAMLVVAVSSPILGAIADHSGSKKRFLFFFTAMACIFTALLFFVGAGDVAAGMTFFILAEIGYRSAQVFYNSLLADVASPDEMASVSGKGWAVGSAGGILCLLVILPLIMFVKGPMVVRASLLITAAWFALSSVPIFTQLVERGERRALPPGETYLSIAFGRIWRTLKRARHFSEFIRFMISFLIYNDGVIMALDFAAIIGAVLFGMDQQMLIIFVIVVQITNVGGAYVFGILAERWSCKRSLILSILLMVVAVVWMYLAPNMVQFFLIGALAGFAMAGIQSVSRTFVSYLSPEGQAAEFFGFFAVAGRTSSFIGPMIYGVIAAEAALWYQGQGMSPVEAEKIGQRLAILSIALFLLVGLALLLPVNEKRARLAAKEASLKVA